MLRLGLGSIRVEEEILLLMSNVVYSSKLKGHGFQIGYEYFVKKHKCTSETIRTKLALLEELGIINDFRILETEYFNEGNTPNNLMHLLVCKDTAHFYSEIGLEKPKKSSSRAIQQTNVISPKIP
jgi:hypothetical protein